MTDPNELVEKALGGDKQAIEDLLLEVKDFIFNLSLRMLGNTHDAEDATQEIIIKVITKLSTFRNDSKFSTWVYKISTNHLLNYKKGLFSKMPPISFEFYGQDIKNGFIENNPALLQGVDEDLLAQELKMSCTNVMLQCFQPEDRIIYILGTMFRVDSKICGEVLEMSPEAYRKRLSRLRSKMSEFLSSYCELGASKNCSCKRRIGYAITSRRLNPQSLEFLDLETLDSNLIQEYTNAMEDIDEMSFTFAELPKYKSPQIIKKIVTDILASNSMQKIQSEAL